MINEYSQHSAASYLHLRKAASHDVRVALPGVITQYNPANQTATIQPAVMEMLNGERTRLPILTDVPVCFPGSSNVAMTFDVQPGDECLVIFADTAIDAWFSNGSIQVASSPRRHSLSDGFAIMGFRSKPNVLPPDDNAFSVRCKVDGEWINAITVDKTGKVTLNQ